MNPRVAHLRFFLRLVSTVLLALGFAGLPARAGRVEDIDGGTVIHVTLFDLPDASKTDPFTRSEVAAVRAFREGFAARFAQRYRARYEADPARYGRHDWSHVEVRLEKFTGIRVVGVEVDLLAIAGGMAPDVLYLNFRKSDNYIQSGFLYPLDRPTDGYLSAMPAAELAERVNAKIWPVIRRRGPTGARHVWALPYGGALGKVLLYRKDLFDRFGVSYPTADWTWDELLDAARRITNPAEGTYGLYLARGKQESAYWCTYLWSAGGEVMTYDDATDRWRCVFDSREAAEAAEFYVRLSAEKWVDADGRIRRGYSTKDVGNIWAKWDRGQIGMLFWYIDENVFATINPEVTGMAPVPKGPTGRRGSELNSRMMALFAGIREPAVRDAAWEYMRFYDSPEALAIKTRVMVEGGLGRFLNPVLLRRYNYPEIERLAPKGWSDIFRIAVETGHPEPYGRNSNLAYDLMSIPLQRGEQLMLTDEMPADREGRVTVMQGLLKEACAKANEEMIGLVPPRERAFRRILAATVLSGLIGAFAVVFRRIAHVFTPSTTAGTAAPATRRARRGRNWAYALLLPALATILMWRYVPLLRGSVMAFQDYRLMGHSSWVGLDNFGDLLVDRAWWQACFNSLRYSVLVMALTFLPPIVLAVLLQEVPRGKLLYRTLYYLPAVTTGLVTVLLWKQFYEPSEHGALNAVILRIPAGGFVAVGAALAAATARVAARLRQHERTRAALCVYAVAALLLYTGVRLAAPILFPAGASWGANLARLPLRLVAHAPEPYRWLGTPDTAMLACVIPMVWAGMGPGCLIYLAALKGIPDDYYEAADIDGATFIDKLLFIVFPMLKALIIINFIGAFINSWYAATGHVLVMTGGGANTEVAGLHIWYKAFTHLKFGPATAMAWMLGFMLIGFTVHQLKILSRVEFRSTGDG